MITYFALIALIIIWNNMNRKHGRDNLLVVGLAFIFVLFFSMRSPNMGHDLQNYLPAFMEINTYTWKEVLTMKQFQNFEYGYIVFNKLIGSIWTNQQFFLMVCAIVTIIPVFTIIKRYSHNYLMSTVIWMSSSLFVLAFSGLRQSIAISICMWGLDYLLRKKYVSYSIVVLFATLFHSSAIICLFAIVAYYLGMDKNGYMVYIMVISVTLIICVVFKTQIVHLLLKIFDTNKELTKPGGYGLLFVLYLLIGLFMCACMDTNNPIHRGLLNIYFIAVIAQSFGTVHMLAERISCYFLGPMILLMSYIFDHKGISIIDDVNQNITIYRKKYQLKFRNSYITIENKKLYEYIIITCFICLFFYRILTTSWSMALPYVPFWEV